MEIARVDERGERTDFVDFVTGVLDTRRVGIYTEGEKDERQEAVRVSQGDE